MVRRNTRHVSAVVTAIGLSAAVLLGAVGSPRPASADWAAPFIGGLIGGHVLTNFARAGQERTQAMQEMAYGRPPAPYGYQSQAVAAPAPAQTSAASIEQKLNILDQLAAKGYITPQQYQERRQALLNSL